MATSFTDEKAQGSFHEDIKDESPAIIEYKKKEAKVLRKLDCFIAPVILLTNVSPGVQYFATYLIASACFLCTGTNIAWLPGNCAPDGKRPARLGILLALMNIGGSSFGSDLSDKGGA